MTFDSNGGSAVEAQTVPFGEKAAKPADPTRTGYSFAGWYTDESFSQAFDFNTALESSITLYAKWTAVPSGSDGTEPETKKPETKPLPANKKLASTGDATAPLAAGVVVLALAAGAAVTVTARRKRD